jgi:hypothetical protein
MNIIHFEKRYIENTINKIRNLINELESSDEIKKIIDIVGEYSDDEFLSNSKKEVINYYFKGVRNLQSKLGDFEEIFEAIKKGSIS